MVNGSERNPDKSSPISSCTRKKSVFAGVRQCHGLQGGLAEKSQFFDRCMGSPVNQLPVFGPAGLQVKPQVGVVEINFKFVCQQVPLPGTGRGVYGGMARCLYLITVFSGIDGLTGFHGFNGRPNKTVESYHKYMPL